MVDKIDRPDPVSKYDILPTKETHDEGQKKQDDRRDEDEFSSPGTELSWNKYRVGSPTREVITLQRSDIRQAIFRQTMLQSRTAILEMDFILTDGRTLPRAHFVSSNLDDYWKWKGWVPGQVVPMDLMIQDPVIKISIQQLSRPTPTPRDSTGTSRVHGKALPKYHRWQDPKTGHLNWLWIAKVSAMAIVGLWIIGKLARWW